jgi:hypothetical protein
MDYREHPNYYHCNKESEKIDECSDEVHKALEAIGIKRWGDREMIAVLLAAAYGEYPEADSLAGFLGLKDENIWCFQNTPKSIDKYRDSIDDSIERHED